jgi:hypothetical protein
LVKQPFVNVEENSDRFVGRRGTPDALSTATSNKAAARGWAKAYGGLRVRPGVYHFKTHEEADAWLYRVMARRDLHSNRASPQSRICATSAAS